MAPYHRVLDNNHLTAIPRGAFNSLENLVTLYDDCVPHIIHVAPQCCLAYLILWRSILYVSYVLNTGRFKPTTYQLSMAMRSTA